MEGLDKLQELMVKFRDERDWKQFHNPKDLAISMMLEAGEVLEHFEWMNEKEQWNKVSAHREEIAEELADVFSYLLLLANDLEINLADAFVKKLEKSAGKYPVEKAKGNHSKYTEL